MQRAGLTVIHNPAQRSKNAKPEDAVGLRIIVKVLGASFPMKVTV